MENENKIAKMAAYQYDLIRQAVARGWCHSKNEKKTMDVDLAEAISYEIAKLTA